MADLIDRQAVIDIVRGYGERLNDHIGTLDDSEVYAYARGLILSIESNICGVPSADVQPVRQTAEWIYGEKDGADGWYCSKCGFHVPWYYEYYGLNNINFIKDFHTCPHCDAKMLKYTGMEREQNG